MLRNQKIDGILRDGYSPDRIFRFRSCDIGFACIVSPCLFADGDRLVFNIQVRPLQRDQLALTQTADELQIEHGQDAALVGN